MLSINLVKPYFCNKYFLELKNNNIIKELNMPLILQSLAQYKLLIQYILTIVT